MLALNPSNEIFSNLTEHVINFGNIKRVYTELKKHFPTHAIDIHTDDTICITVKNKHYKLLTLKYLNKKISDMEIKLYYNNIIDENDLYNFTVVSRNECLIDVLKIFI